MNFLMGVKDPLMNAPWGLKSNVLNVIFGSKDLLSISHKKEMQVCDWKNCKFYANLYKDI